jgi:hypothetical protein
MIPVSLSDLVGEMTLLSDEVHGYLNRVTGEMITITDDEIRDVENEEDFSQRLKWEQEVFEKTQEVLESDDYLELPSHFEIHDYAIMEDYCISYPNEAMSEDLADLIHGSGAFRRFKNYISRHGIEQDWYRFHDNAYKKIAIEWLEENGIAYTDDMTGK